MEQLLPEDKRVLVDDLMPKLLTGSAAFWQWAMHWEGLRKRIYGLMDSKGAGAYALFICRKRFIRDHVLSVMDEGISAVVNLGAGTDTLVYREAALANTPCWEVDQPSNIVGKRRGIEGALGAVPSHVTLVPLDFDTQSLEEGLAEAGFHREQKVFYILEAVSQYLTVDGVKATFDYLAGAQSGSYLAFTYIRKGFIEGTDMYGMDFMYKKTVPSGLWKFGLSYEEVESFLAGFGWELIEQQSSEQLAARYGAEVGREISGTPLEPVVFARKK